MKLEKIKIDGVYDYRTLQFLLGSGVRCYSFDFRPLSFNFLQQHVFHKLLELLVGTRGINIFLHFANEKEYVIQKILTDLRVQMNRLDLWQVNLCLEFSDHQSSAYYDQFGLPYFWHCDDLAQRVRFQESAHLQGFFVPMSCVAQLETHLDPSAHYRWGITAYSPEGALNDMSSQGRPCEISFFARAIDSSIEVCYRNVDLQRLDQLILQLLGGASVGSHRHSGAHTTARAIV